MRKKFALIYFITDLALIAFFSYFGAIYVLNSQLALIASTLIIFASFWGYKNKIAKKALSADIKDFDEVFDDEDLDDEPKQNDKAKEEQIKNEAKAELKKSKIPLRLYDFASVFAPLRLLSYAFLVLVFLYLQSHALFEPFSFLAGLGIMPLCALVAGFLDKE